MLPFEVTDHSLSDNRIENLYPSNKFDVFKLTLSLPESSFLIFSTSYIKNLIPLNKVILGIDLSPLLNNEYFFTFLFILPESKEVFLSKKYEK